MSSQIRSDDHVLSSKIREIADEMLRRTGEAMDQSQNFIVGYFFKVAMRLVNKFFAIIGFECCVHGLWHVRP
jgi:hypothetical protein